MFIYLSTSCAELAPQLHQTRNLQCHTLQNATCGTVATKTPITTSPRKLYPMQEFFASALSSFYKIPFDSYKNLCKTSYVLNAICYL